MAIGSYSSAAITHTPTMVLTPTGGEDLETRNVNKHDLDNLGMFRSQWLSEDSRQERRIQGLNRHNGDEEEMRKLFFCEEIKTLLFFFRVSGAIPIQQTNTGWEFKIFSPVFLYSLCAYFSVLVLTLIVISDTILNTDEESDSRWIFRKLFLQMWALYIFVPWAFWQDAPHIAAYLNKWTDFQVLYSKTTQINLDLKIKKRVLILATIMPVTTIFAAIVAVGVLNTKYPLWASVTMCFNSIAFWSLISLWILSCYALSEAGESLAQCFKVDLATNNANNTCTSTVMGQYRTLWLQLSGLARTSGNAVYRVFIPGILLTMWFITISLYGEPVALKEGDYTAFTIYVIMTISCIVPLYFIFGMGYMVPIKIKKPIQTELQKWNTTNLSCEAWTQMMAFLRVTHTNDPVISLGGFVIVDRKLLQSMLSTIATYLIVLLQFRSAQDAKRSAIEDE